MVKEILVLFSLTKKQKELLKGAAPQAEFRFSTCLDATREEVPILSLATPCLNSQDAKNLEWQHLPSAGAKEYVNGVLPKGTLLGAGPNVTDPEPLPKRHRLWKAADAYMTPYILGGSIWPKCW